AIVREDAVCRRLMTVPGVGPVVAVTFKSGVDDPSRIAKSKAVGAPFGLTPKKYQSGEKDVTGGIEVPKRRRISNMVWRLGRPRRKRQWKNNRSVGSPPSSLAESLAGSPSSS